MRFLPPKPPNENEIISRAEVFKRGVCGLFHQKEWLSYVAGVDPTVDIAICSKCGAEHLIKKGFITAAETRRRIDKALKTRIQKC